MPSRWSLRRTVGSPCSPTQQAKKSYARTALMRCYCSRSGTIVRLTGDGSTNRSPEGHGPIKRDAIGADIHNESFGPLTLGHEFATVFVDGNDFRFLWHVGHRRQIVSAEVERPPAFHPLASPPDHRPHSWHAKETAEDARGTE